MHWLKDQLRRWLFPLELASLKGSLQREEELLSLLQLYRDSLRERSERRLTLQDLQLNPGEAKTLQGASAAFRRALWKAGEHKVLTTVPECCRKTAQEQRDYYHTLTLSPGNVVPDLDETPEDRQKEQLQQYLRKRYDPR